MKNQNVQLEVRKSDFSADGNTIVGKAIVFESQSNDLGGFVETIKRGAITQELLDNSDVFARFNHSDDYILARSNHGVGSLKLTLKDDGVYYEFEAPNTEKGKELVEHIRRGEVYQSSFAFSVAPERDAEKWYKENGVTHRDIYKISYLGDIAPVFTPAYGETTVSLRALEQLKELDEDVDVKHDDNPTDKDDKKDDIKEEDTPIEEEKNKEEDTPKEKEDVKEEEAPREDDDSSDKDNKKENKRKLNFKNMEFRLLNAINAIANNKQVDETSAAVIGAGVEEMRKSGLSYGGQIQIPTSELRATITVATEGEDVVPTDLYDILEPLRAKNVLVAAGAKFLTGLVGDVQVPSMNAGNVTWEGETAAAKDAGYTFSSVKLSPKRLTAYVDISKQFLVQDSKSAEALIRQDIINAINTKLEATILGTEAGTTTKPAGIFNGKTVNKIASFADVCKLEANIEDANVNGECKYVMSNKAKAAFRNMAKSTKSTELVMEGGSIDGTAVLNTSNVQNQDVVYGDFSNLAIGQWGGIDLTVDPYTKAAEGQVRLVVNAYFDAKVLREGAFAYGTTDSAATAY